MGIHLYRRGRWSSLLTVVFLFASSGSAAAAYRQLVFSGDVTDDFVSSVEGCDSSPWAAATTGDPWEAIVSFDDTANDDDPAVSVGSFAVIEISLTVGQATTHSSVGIIQVIDDIGANDGFVVSAPYLRVEMYGAPAATLSSDGLPDCAEVEALFSSSTLSYFAALSATDEDCLTGSMNDVDCDGICGVDPSSAPPRPMFHALDATQTPNSEDIRIPDYIEVSNNLKVLRSVQLLISLATRAASQLKDAKSKVESVEALGDCICPDPQGTVPSKTRKECENETCFAGTVPVPPVAWLPTDLYKGPLGDSRFALAMAKLLDRAQTWAESLAGPIEDLEQIGITLTTFKSELAGILNWINRLTDGFHLGAYSDQRPNLHMCVGYGGHEVYSELAGLGQGELSIGAQYASANLSAKHRAQYRAGGFGAVAFGESLRIAPGIESNLQFDGFRLWDTEAPWFPIPATEIRLCEINQFDFFHLVDEDVFRQLACPNDTSADPCNCVLSIPAEFLVKDLYTTPYGPNTWPRPGIPFDWEKKSIAVLGAGLNLREAIDPIADDLEPIPFGYFTVIPHYSLEAGVQWYQQVNNRRNALQNAINKHIANEVNRLNENDFYRPEPMQADDVTEDAGVTAFAKPGIGASVAASISPLKSVSFGLTFSATLQVLLEPGGFGGVSDLNWALNEALYHSNPPDDEPCDPVTEVTTTSHCSSEDFRSAAGDHLSTGEYCCEGCTASDAACADYGICRLEDGADGIAGNSDDGLVLHDWSREDCEGVFGTCSPYSGNAGVSCDGDEDCTPSPVNYCDGGTSDESPCTTNADCPAGFCNVAYASGCIELEGTRLFSPYHCVEQSNIAIVGAEGPGCHPLMWGFPAAGTTCDAAPCPPGHECIDNACLLSCSTNIECEADEVCDPADGVCVNRSGVPFAEQIVWGVENVPPPMHVVSSYAWSSFTWGVYLPISIRLGMDISVFRIQKSFNVFEYDDVFELAADSRGKHQIGLEAQYQDQCADPSAVTNRQPDFVERYNPDGVTTDFEGNAGDTRELEQWCKAVLPTDVDDPAAPTEANILGAIEDVVGWGKEIGEELWARTALCIDGRPLYEWADATLADLEQNPDSIDCTYDDGLLSFTFPCSNVDEAMMLAGGCLNRDLDGNSERLWDHFDGSGAINIHGGTFNGHDVFDLDAMLIDPSAEATWHNLKEDIREFGVFAPRGFLWYLAARQCLESFLASAPSNAVSVSVGTVGPCCGDGEQQVDGCGNAPGGGDVPPCEACDDGNTVGGDGCSSVCRLESGICGNGVLEAPEQCDEGPANFLWHEGGCCPDCSLPPCDRCGDGTVDAGEQCDDGNNRDGDGCSARCDIERRQTKGEAGCTSRMNKVAVALAEAHGRDHETCIGLRVLDKIATTVDACMVSDIKGAIAKAELKTAQTFDRYCPPPLPPYGVTDPATVIAAAYDEASGLVADAFGSPVDPVLSGARDVGMCHRAVFKAMRRLMKAKHQIFLTCKKKKLKSGVIVSPATLAAECFGEILADEKQKIATRREDLAKAFQKSCTVLGPLLFPGRCTSESSTLPLLSCLDAAVECRVCRFFRTIDGLDYNCDLFDDGSENASCD